MPSLPKVHLVTYATPRFRHRQILLGISARLNHVADTVTAWTPEQLRKAGFEDKCEGIKLSERGSGFWAWKPFIIDAKLREVRDGDLVFYCDVGRLYPFKLLDQPIAQYLDWMQRQGQEVMPGIAIPWEGNNAEWTKREVLATMEMDRAEIHSASPIQASFSLWRASKTSRDLASKWLNLCSSRKLVSDDPSSGSFPELPGFRAHRHDQALLTLCCLQENVRPLAVGDSRPDYDAKNPSAVSRHRFGEIESSPTLLGKILRSGAALIGKTEQLLRRRVKFGTPLSE